MTHAELLRKHADEALREGGMYYSGEYLSNMADVAESLERENAELRELATAMYTYRHDDCYSCRWYEECKKRTEWKCIAPERINEMAHRLRIGVTK